MTGLTRHLFAAKGACGALRVGTLAELSERRNVPTASEPLVPHKSPSTLSLPGVLHIDVPPRERVGVGTFRQVPTLRRPVRTLSELASVANPKGRAEPQTSMRWVQIASSIDTQADIAHGLIPVRV